MSIVGKILIALNLVALAGFGFLGFQVLQKRAAWSHAVTSYDLALNGIPVDETERDARGRPKADSVSATYLKTYVGDAAITTQMKEVADLEAKIKNKIENDDKALRYPDPKDPKLIKNANVVQKQAWVLLRLATTLEEREGLWDVWNAEDNPERTKALPEAEKKRLEKLTASLPAWLASAFSDSQLSGTSPVAAAPAEGAEGGTPASASKPLKDQEIGHKRRAIAHLLVNLHDAFPDEADAGKTDPFDRPSYKRVLAVCGARAVAVALEMQARHLEQMSLRLTDLIEVERLIFADAHQLQLYQVLDKATQLARHELSLAEATNQANLQKKRTEDQQKAFDDAMKALAAAQTETGGELVRVERLQQLLYDTRLKLRDANRLNQQLEAQIRQLEKQIGPTRPSSPPVSTNP